METEVIFKKSFKFTDEDNCVINIDVKVDKVTGAIYKRSFIDLSPMPEYLTLSITGKDGMSSGQIYDHIKPRLGSYQFQFKSFWKRYHLNEMQPGSNRQMNYLESCYEDDYKEVSSFVNSMLDARGITKEKLKTLDRYDKMPNAFGELGRCLLKLFGNLDRVHAFLKELTNAHSGLSKVRNSVPAMCDVLTTPYMKNDYSIKRAFLAGRGLLNDRGYVYGTDWLVKEFDFEELKRLINAVIDEENKFKKENRQELIERYNKSDDEEEEEEVELPDVNEDTQELLDLVESECNCDETDAKRIIALLRSERIDLDELWNIDVSGGSVISYGSIEYYVDSYSILRQIAIDYLMDERDAWVEAVKSNSTDDGLKDWVEDVVDTDGLGATLNHWDGTEDYEHVFGEEVYIIRR